MPRAALRVLPALLLGWATIACLSPVAEDDGPPVADSTTTTSVAEQPAEPSDPEEGSPDTDATAPTTENVEANVGATEETTPDTTTVAAQPAEGDNPPADDAEKDTQNTSTTALTAEDAAQDAGATEETAPDTVAELPADDGGVEVVRVTDGDTIVVLLDGEDIRVRLIGVNAPESDECLAEESGMRLGELLEEGPVRLETDVGETDRFGRMLAYLWAGDVLINERLAAEGLVLSRAYPPNTARQSELDEAAEEARRSGLGMWAADACGPPTGAELEITEIRWNPPGPDEDDMNEEYVVLRNLSDMPASLDGFVLRDTSSSNRFYFPDGWVLPGGAEVTIRTGAGPDDDRNLFWGSNQPVWNNNGDAAFLLDPSGNIAAYFSYTG